MRPWKYRPARDQNLSPLERARSVHREVGLMESATHLGWLLFVRTYLRVFHRLRVWGRTNIPKEPPFVLVSNHTSHLDALVLASVVPLRLANRVFPVAAADVFFDTSAGSIFSSFMINALPVWRKSCGPGALRELRERLVGDPCSYILFPEGGRSRDGTMQSFRAGLGIVIAQTPVDVVPCFLQGAFQAMPPGSRWPRPRKLRLSVGQALRFDQAPNDREGWRMIARECENAVRRLGGLPVGRGERVSAAGEPEGADIIPATALPPSSAEPALPDRSRRA